MMVFLIVLPIAVACGNASDNSPSTAVGAQSGHQGTPAGTSATTTSTAAGTPTTLTVGNTDGTKVTRADSADGPVTYFVWQDNGTSFQITAQLTGFLTEHDVEQIIASMLGNS